MTEEEFEVVKTHAVLGARVLQGGDSDVIQTAEAIARHHHERWDGGGYPGGLAGDAIPIAARLVHLADVFDVLVHERPYKESWTVEAAVAEIERGRARTSIRRSSGPSCARLTRRRCRISGRCRLRGS